MKRFEEAFPCVNSPISEQAYSADASHIPSLIMTAMRIIRIIMIMAVILTMKTIIPMMIQRITMTLPERSSLQLLPLSQWVYLWWSFLL